MPKFQYIVAGPSGWGEGRKRVYVYGAVGAAYLGSIEGKAGSWRNEADLFGHGPDERRKAPTYRTRDAAAKVLETAMLDAYYAAHPEERKTPQGG